MCVVCAYIVSVGHTSHRLMMDKCLENCDVLCNQEDTFLSTQDLERLKSLNENFYGAGESTTGYNTTLVQGIISAGVAVLWRKSYGQLIKVIKLEVDWAIGLEFSFGNKKFIIILNIYTPYESPKNEEVYLNRLAYLVSYIQDNPSTSFLTLFKAK